MLRNKLTCTYLLLLPINQCKVNDKNIMQARCFEIICSLICIKYYTKTDSKLPDTVVNVRHRYNALCIQKASTLVYLLTCPITSAPYTFHATSVGGVVYILLDNTHIWYIHKINGNVQLPAVVMVMYYVTYAIVIIASISSMVISQTTPEACDRSHVLCAVAIYNWLGAIL